jgi:16S rRNA (guanine966-N2)-methyltransferase
MRIISGTHRSRKLHTLPGLSTRPMLDQKKEAVFNILGPYFEGGVVLDIFGGSGALSLEAISRGCLLAYINDQSIEAVNIIRKNVESLKEEKKFKIYNLDYVDFLNQVKKQNVRFDYIFLDPPYKLNVINDIIKFLFDNNMINKNAFIICQYLKENYSSSETKKLGIVKRYSYRDSELTIYEVK